MGVRANDTEHHLTLLHTLDRPHDANLSQEVQASQGHGDFEQKGSRLQPTNLFYYYV